MSNASPMPAPTVLLNGLAYVESPRWHAGRLWFAHWGTGEIVAVDLDGHSEVVGHGPPKVNAAAPGHGLGWSIDWLPDGRLLVTGKELLCRELDGSMVRHADLSEISTFGWNEIVVDGRGHIYVNSIQFGFLAAELSLDQVLQRIVEVAARVAGARYGALGIAGPDDGYLTDFIITGISPQERAKIAVLPRGHGLLGVLIRQGRPLRVPNIAHDRRRVGFPPHPTTRR